MPINKNKNLDLSKNLFIDLSKNKVFYIDKNKIKNIHFKNTLQVSNTNIFSNINSDKNLKSKYNNFDMKIKGILNDIKKKRNKNDGKSLFVQNMDQKSIDLSNNQIVKYNDTLKNTLINMEQQYKTNYFYKNKFVYNTNTYSIYDKNSIFSKNFDFKLPPQMPIKEIEKKKIIIQVEIENIDSILDLIEKYPLRFDVEYNINMEALHNIKEPMIQLKEMIGMKELKNSILDQILYFIQNLHIIDNNQTNDFMHTCIYGPPGTGKTEIAKIIGKIFSKLGILKKGKFKKAVRSDFIAGYLGQTALKTKDLVNQCLGGVLFIDEAYALGNNEKRDSFAKECIDTLCEALSDHKGELMVIIAGYKDELKKCFFEYNKGLDSRFTWRFETDNYDAEELKLIFFKKVKEIHWKISDKIKTVWFENNFEYFKFYGRDMETLLAKVKIAHSRRVFCLKPEDKKFITKKDMDKGFELFIDNDEVKSRKNHSNIHHMYV